MEMAEELLFEVQTPLNVTVRCSRKWWLYISTVKHPTLEGRADDVRATLANPQEIRRSTKDPDVFLFYRLSPPRFLCVVARQENGEGLLITAYPTDSLKKGEIVWSASE